MMARPRVRQIFKSEGGVDGAVTAELQRRGKVRIIRDGIQVSGERGSRKRFKADVREVRRRLECGLTSELTHKVGHHRMLPREFARTSARIGMIRAGW